MRPNNTLKYNLNILQPMNILGLEIKRTTKDDKEFGEILMVIQIRRGGVTIRGPDGLHEVDRNHIDIRDYFAGIASMQRTNYDMSVARTFTPQEIQEWINYGNADDPLSYHSGFLHVIEARNEKPSGERDKDYG